MSLQDAQREAVRRATADLVGVEMASRCRLLWLPQPQADAVRFRAFGVNLVLRLPGFDLTLAEGGAPARLGDQLLVLHYLRCAVSPAPTGEPISFRDLPGGRVYWQPFLSRSITPLLRAIGNDLERLTRHLDRFDWQPVAVGDLGARIHALGRIEATLVYRKGDEEFEPTAELLFDACIRRVYTTEDVAYLAGRICLGLL